MSERTVNFFQYLAKRCDSNNAVGAHLRRSLSFPPGEWPHAFPYIEPFVSGTEENEWQRKMFYLAAGVWAAAREKNGNMPFGQAICVYMDAKKSESIEKRFIALLDSDAEQIPHRLRQMCTLLKDSPIDFALLLDGLLYWNDPGKKTQWKWARDFYSVPADVAVIPGIEENEA